MFNEPNDKQPERGPFQAKIPGGFTIVFFLITIFLFITFLFRGGNTSPVREVPYSDFLRFVDQNQIESVIIHDNNSMDITIKGNASEGKAQLRTRIPYSDPNLLTSLREKNINVTGAASRPGLMRILLEMFPWFIGFGIIYIMFRNMQGAGMKNFHFGKSKAKRYHD